MKVLFLLIASLSSGISVEETSSNEEKSSTANHYIQQRNQTLLGPAFQVNHGLHLRGSSYLMTNESEGNDGDSQRKLNPKLERRRHHTDLFDTKVGEDDETQGTLFDRGEGQDDNVAIVAQAKKARKKKKKKRAKEKSKRSKTKKSSNDSKVQCFEGDRVECGVGKINICRFDQEQKTHTTNCMTEADVSGHLAAYKQDYYGVCEEDIFVEKSVLLNVPPEEGTEIHELYEVDYNVTFNQDGIIVLANAFDIIDGVICSPGPLYSKLEILFSKPLSPSSLLSMFPEKAILVVDGDLFDTKCNFSPSSEDGQDHNVGFLGVLASHVHESIVTVIGAPAVFDMIFQKQSMHYHRLNGARRELEESVSLDDKVGTLEFTVPDDDFKIFGIKSPIQFSSAVDVSGHAYVDNFQMDSDFYWYDGPTVFVPITILGYTRWVKVELKVPALELAVSAEVDYGATLALTNTVRVWVSPTGRLSLPVASFDPIGEKEIMTFTVPNWAVTILKLAENKLGSSLRLTFHMPFAFSFDMASSFQGEIKSQSSISIGQRMMLGLKGNTVNPLSLMPVNKLLGSSSSKGSSGNFLDANGFVQTVSDSSVFSVEAILQAKPSMRLNVLDLGWIGVGDRLRFESVSAYRRGKFAPTNSGLWCDKCHTITSELSLVYVDLFLSYKPKGGSTSASEKAIDPNYTKYDLGKICLMPRVGHIPCGNVCCDPSDICMDEVCQNPICLTECCRDDDCKLPHVCNQIQGKCVCPFECCDDTKCLAVGKVCDSFTHQCRSEDDHVSKQPLKILHIGDSFSSGTAGGDYSGPEGCYRSAKSWGRLLSDTLKNHFAVRYVNRACSGGITADYFKPRSSILGKEPGPLCNDPMEDEMYIKKGLDCIRTVKPQYQYVTADVDFVFSTFGGNDLGFANIVKYCFLIGKSPILPASIMCRDAIDNAAKPLNDGTFEASIMNVMRNVTARMKPTGTVIFSTYPHILTDALYMFTRPLYNAGGSIRNMALTADNLQRSAIMKVNGENKPKGLPIIHFFDGTKDVFDGHEPDPTDKENPDRWMVEPFGSLSPSNGTDQNEWYHPNPRGQREWAKALAQWLEPIIAGTFNVMSSTDNNGSNNIDLAFVIDTTSSMNSDISSVKSEMANIVNQIANTFQSYRIAIVTYRDFPPDGSNVYPGSYGDYPSRIDLDFNSDFVEIQAGISALRVSGGGDFEETVLSGLNAALGLDWRPGVTKVTILMGDAPAKIIGGSEPNSGLTEDDIIAKSKALDPVQIMAVSRKNLGEAVDKVATGTGGSVETNSGGVVAAIERILDNVSKQPFAWFGESIVARIGYPMLFDASGSFDPLGGGIASFEWDFDGDGIYDELTDQPAIIHTYSDEFAGIVLLRVTSAGGQGVASAHLVVNGDGSLSQLGGAYCEINETTALPVMEDDDGIQLRCRLNSTIWPSRADLNMTVEDYTALIEGCLEALQLPIVSLQPCEVQHSIRVMRRQVETGDYDRACDSIEVVAFLENKDHSCMEMCQVMMKR